jgi:FMN phosphatase YigB (HAD superfamily)
MVISFDLDDTLIPGTKQFATIERNFLQKLWGVEKIRTGTIQLMKACQAQGHQVYIYTTSYRTPRKIWWMFYLYGIKVDKIINQDIHNKTLGNRTPKPSKYPPAFNIDLHIDDSKGVETEGKNFSFRTLIISEDNHNWTTDILQLISPLKNEPGF